jgi:multimeric flavodoxin WrbA
MQVIGIVASPRHGRNTATLVQGVLDGAQSQGAETALLYLEDYEINPCRACDACKETGECIQDDDMTVFYEALEGAKGIVVGTPIYFDHISAQAKTFIDRLYPYLGPNGEHLFPKGVKSVLALTWEASNSDLYANVAEWLKDRLAYYWEIETVDVLMAANTDKVAVSERKDLLQEAFAAGVKLGKNRS